MTQTVFNEETLSDGNAHDSELFLLGGNRTDLPINLMVQIGCTVSTGSGDNLVTVQLYVSPDRQVVTLDADATWYKILANDFKPISVLVGNNYPEIGEIDSTLVYQVTRDIVRRAMWAKLVATRRQVNGGGTNTVKINAFLVS